MSVSLLVGEYIVISSPLIEVVVSYIKKLATLISDFKFQIADLENKDREMG
jgi:hypothetical protein